MTPNVTKELLFSEICQPWKGFLKSEDEARKVLDKYLPTFEWFTKSLWNLLKKIEELYPAKVNIAELYEAIVAVALRRLYALHSQGKIDPELQFIPPEEVAKHPSIAKIHPYRAFIKILEPLQYFVHLLDNENTAFGVIDDIAIMKKFDKAVINGKIYPKFIYNVSATIKAIVPVRSIKFFKEEAIQYFNYKESLDRYVIFHKAQTQSMFYNYLPASILIDKTLLKLPIREVALVKVFVGIGLAYSEPVSVFDYIIKIKYWDKVNAQIIDFRPKEVILKLPRELKEQTIVVLDIAKKTEFAEYYDILHYATLFDFELIHKLNEKIKKRLLIGAKRVGFP